MTEQSTGRSERDRILAGLRYCAAVFLVMRVGLTLVGLAGVALLPGLDPVDAPGWAARPITPGWHNAVTAFERFDALWFLGIASRGYGPANGTLVFFPGYPLLIRGVSPLLGGHPLAAGLLVSNLCAFGSMVVLYFLSASEWDETVARRAVVYLAVFPTAFFLLAPYSESPFLLLALTSLWAARRDRWAVAGLAGAAAAATRNVGVLLALPLLAEALSRYREGQRSGTVARAAWSVAPVVGIAAVLAFARAVSGDWLAPVHQQATWQRELAFPLVTVIRATGIAFRFLGNYPGGYHLMDWLVVAPALAAGVWVALRTRLLYGVYTWAMLLAPLSFVFQPRPFMSLPRFLLPIFPILWAPAVWARRRPGVHTAVVAASAAALGLLTILFAAWYYVF